MTNTNNDVRVYLGVQKNNVAHGEILLELFSKWLFMNGITNINSEHQSSGIDRITTLISKLRQLLDDNVIDLRLFVDSESERENSLNGMAAVIERTAKAIYNQWSKEPGYTPWQDGGNSDMQEKARKLAAEAHIDTDVKTTALTWTNVEQAFNGKPSQFPGIETQHREVVVQVSGPPGSGVCNLSAYLGHLLKDAGYEVDVKTNTAGTADTELIDEPLFTKLTLEQVRNNVLCWGAKAPVFHITGLTKPVSHFE